MFNSFTSCFSISHSHYTTCYIMYFSFLLHNLLGRVTYLFSYAKRHNHAGGLWAITNDVLKFRKIIEFQSSWIVNELCTRTLKVPSSCPPIAHIRRWTAWKIIFLRSLAPKCSTSDKKKQKRKYKNAKTEKTHTHKQGTRQRKLEISSYKMQL